MDIQNGKLLPQCLDIEEAVLGAMLIDSKQIDEVFTIISTSNVFYKQSHVFIFEAIQSLYNDGNPIDLLTVGAELRKKGNLEQSGGDFYLIELTQKISSSAHIEFHARMILQKFIARQVILFSSKIIAVAYDETTDVFELMQRWQKEFDNVSDFTNTGRATINYADALQKLKEEVQLLSDNKDQVKLVGIDTGFERINKYTGGYRNQDLVIVAARPGMGKTAYVLKLAIENVKKMVPVGFISLEMSIAQLTARTVAIDTNFHLTQLLKKGFEHQEYFNTYTQHQQRMQHYPLYIDDSGKTDITDIVITAKLWVRKYGMKVLIVDYLQLVTDRSVKGNRESEISSISRRLKRLAKELDIPVIALSQLSRAVEQRGSSKRPMLSDLRESGAIEQDADIVQFLYRPEYYKIEMDPEEYGEAEKELVYKGANSEVIFAKYRGGSTNTALLKWIGDKTKFVDVESASDMQEADDTFSTQDLPKISPAAAFDVTEFNVDNPF
jgi:replicative DNA helicase